MTNDHHSSETDLDLSVTDLDALQRSHLLPDAARDRVGVIGSSAGGLLAGLLATGAVLSVEPRPSRIPRPRFHIQSYGIADLRLLPAEAVDALLGDGRHLAEELSPLTHIDSATTPSFIWTTAEDAPGLEQALTWTRALTDHGVSTETHVYPEGPHGVGLADGVPYGPHERLSLPHTAGWTTACRRWIDHVLSSPVRSE